MSNPNSTGNNQVVSARPNSVELVVYQGGDAVIDETRTVELLQGKNNILLEGLPAQFVENSFEINDASGPGAFKLGADCFTPADLNTQALLQKALKTKVTFIEQTQQGVLRHTGKLIYILGNQVVLETSEGILVLPLTTKFELGELPQGLSETPSLTLEPTVSEAGSYVLNSSYETGGVSWTAHYIVHLDQKSGEIRRLRCRVKLSNETGADYNDAVFKLLAAYNTSRARNSGNRKSALRQSVQTEALQFAPGGAGLQSDSVQVESAGDQKMYTLPEALSIRNGQTKRPYLLVTEHVPVRTEYHLPHGDYYPNQPGVREEDSKLPVFARVFGRNDLQSKLGLPLPSGDVAVYQPDSSGKFRKTDPSLYLPAVADGEGFRFELTTPVSDLKATRVLTDWSEDPAEEETEVNPVEEGGLPEQFPIGTPGGPGVGTPEAHSRVHSELADAAESDDDADDKKKKQKPRFRTESRRVTVYNFKDEAAEVFVHEALPGLKVEILHQTQGFAEQNLSQGTIQAKVPAKGKTVIEYGLKWQIN